MYELLRNTGFKGVSLDMVRDFARQLVRALAVLARPDVRVMHGDLKPENIALVHRTRSHRSCLG